jgi:hypothetical protein
MDKDHPDPTKMIFIAERRCGSYYFSFFVYANAASLRTQVQKQLPIARKLIPTIMPAQ